MDIHGNIAMTINPTSSASREPQIGVMAQAA